MEIAAFVLLILFSLTGLAAIFLTTFGTFIIFMGILLYAWMTGFSAFGLKTLLLVFVLYLTGEVLEYLFVIMGAKKFGASNWAVGGAIAGGIAGAILGAGIPGVGLIIGTFLGIFIGAFLVELMVKRDLMKSLKAGTGGVFGRVGSVVAKLIIACVIFAILAVKIMSS